MAKKRPSYVSIRSRQKRLIEYLGQTGKSDKQVAKELGVTPQQLRTFSQQRSQTVRARFNRSPAFAKLYDASTTKNLRKQAKASGKTVEFRQLRAYSPVNVVTVQKTPGYTSEYVTELSQSSANIRYLYYREVPDSFLPKLQWARYTKEHNLPISIKVIQLEHRNGLIPRDEYEELLMVWKDVYNLSDDYYQGFR